MTFFTALWFLNIIAFNGLGLADVTALAFRLFGKLGRDDRRTNDE